MARSELVEKYQDLVDKYDLLRQRVNKAVEQKHRFKNAVVERVIADYEKQAGELEAQLAPCEDEMLGLVRGLEADRAKLEAEKTSLDERHDEMELRNILGEFEGDDYDVQSAQLQSDLQSVAQRSSALDEELESYRSLLRKAGAEERRSGPKAVVPVAPLKPPEPEPPPPRGEVKPVPVAAAPRPVVASRPAPEPVPVPATLISREEPAASDGLDPLWGGPAPMHVPDPIPEHVAPSGHDVFDSAFGAPSNGADIGGGNAFEMILDDFPMTVDTGLGKGLPPLNGPGLEGLNGLTELDNQWQKDLADDFPPASGFHDMLDPGAPGALNDRDFPNLGFSDRVDDLPPLGINGQAVPRAAYLIRRESRPDEDRYEIRDDVTSIGRGRDNQIQIKDDTKVSRYHCRILREPGGYFVEDNNSSNGTMVNGELITRRKVEGGEDVTIGETVFRFQLR